MSAPQEYVTDVAYVRGFEKSLSPVQLRLCAALNGFTPPPLGVFDYCELGCAHGDTTVALAASHPNARFIGIDLNAEHVASAEATARNGKVENVRFLERDFETLDRGELPQFDYIVAHGVLSWIGPHKRKAMLELVSSKLKPGGLAFVTYNALPGWAAVEPLRQLILARAALAPDNSLEGARLGLEFAKALDAAGAYYFSSNPAAKAMLGTMEKAGLHYVVHEYLHAHWVPMYFAQLASEMAAKELYFVGQLPLFLNFRDVSIPESMQSLFRQVGDRLAFEGLKDFALNTYFRSDLFIKGKPTLTPEATKTYFEETPFGMLGTERTFDGEAPLPNHTLRYRGPIFDALVPILREGAKAGRSLLGRPELASFGEARLREALVHLLLGECIAPMAFETKARTSVERPTLASAYDQSVLQRALVTDTPAVLASRAAGNGIRMSKLDAVALAACVDVELAQRDAWVRAFCRDGLTSVHVGDRVVTDLAERQAVVLEAVERFRTTRLPKLAELGIVTDGAESRPVR